MDIRNFKPEHAPTEGRLKHFQERLYARLLAIGDLLQKQILQGLADTDEEEKFAPERASHLLKLVLSPCVTFLKHVRKRWQQAGSFPRAFCIGLASFLAALLITLCLRPLMRNEGGLIFLCAVMVSAILGGLRAGLFASGLTILLGINVLHHLPQATHPGGTFRLCLFTLLALITCALSDSLYLARQEAETARRQAENLARRSQFLARASALLDSSRDPVTLALQVMHAIVPAFAEGAIIDLVTEPQALRRVASMHQNPEKEALLQELNFRFPLNVLSHHPIANALRTGRAEVIENVDELLLTTISEDADHLELVRRFGTRSLLCAPLVARNRTFGVLTLISTSEEQRYTPTDLVVAKDLALRMALALDNLRLYHAAQEEISERAHMEQQIREYSEHLEEQRLQLEEANIRLSMQVSTDGLTGLNNHMAFQEALAKEVHRAMRYQSSLSVLLLDVDKFKQYNDTYGHPAGDQVLRRVAAALKGNARDTDFVARYGGEEFAVILPNTAEADALDVAERLRGAVEALRGLERDVTASFGVATLSGPVHTPPELIAWADKALYAAKHAGRNRVIHADALHADDQAVVHAPNADVCVHEAVVSARNATSSERS